MRAIWKGALTFGLVNVPVKLYSAIDDHDLEMHQVHGADGGRIRYQRRCEVCGKVIEFKDIDKAYDDGEQTVILTKDDLSSLPSEKSREIEVVEFVPNEQIDPLMLDRSYYLEPDSTSPKAYVLLRRTLESADRTAIVQFSLRQKVRLGALRVRGDVLVLQSMLWSDEVRQAEFPILDEAIKVSAKELELSASLIESFSSDFTPADFVDDYQVELRTLVEQKLKLGDAIDTEATFGAPKEEKGGEVIDLMEALRRSVDKARKTGAKAPSKRSGSKDEAPVKKAQ
jgi:DNA end-binding protein Ku